MSNMDANFENLIERIEDAYENHFIDGDAKDRITDAMTKTYILEARQVALANGDIDEDDDDQYAYAELDELYSATQNKAQFVSDLDVALAYASKVQYASELADLVKAARPERL
jgi:hypothetical protein